MNTHDFWPSGIFDNTATNRREVRLDGRVTRFVERKCCGDTETSWAIVRKPWGAFPDYPSYQVRMQA